MRTYREEILDINTLVGKKVLAAYINQSKDAMHLKTDDGDFFLRWVGECCASCYIAHMNGANFLIGATILSAENTEWKDIERNEDEVEVMETMGTKLKTSKGYVDIETRVEHNGYYGGHINVSRKGYVDAYSCFDKVDKVNKVLEDF